MVSNGLSDYCKKGSHIDCSDCICKCHIPGTMEYMSRNIAKLEKEKPGLGDSLPGFEFCLFDVDRFPCIFVIAKSRNLLINDF